MISSTDTESMQQVEDNIRITTVGDNNKEDETIADDDHHTGKYFNYYSEQ